MGYPKQPGQDAESHLRVTEKALLQSRELAQLREENERLRTRVAQLEAEKAEVVAVFNPAGLEIDMPEELGGERLMDALCALAAQEGK